MSRDSTRRQKIRWREPAVQCRLSALGLVILACANCLAVETDSFRLHALQHHNAQRSWENVNGTQFWVSGVQPVRHRGNRFHTVVLSPGQQTTLSMPAQSMVRVFRVHQPLTTHDVELWLSDGAGLYSKRTSAISEDHRSLFLVPDSLRPSMVRARRPADANSSIELAIFVSRSELPSGVVPYQEHPVAFEPTFKIRRSSDAKAQNFFCLHREQGRMFSLKGPARIAVETRLRYPPDERRSLQTYRLRARLNSRYQTLEYETGVETRLVFVDERAEVLGRREVAYLDIPSGTHEVELETTADIYARLLSYGSADYLLRLNQPTWLRPGHLPPPRLQPDSLSSWNLSPHDMELLPQFPGEFIDSQEQAAHRSARDNGHPEGGLRGMMLMRTAAAYRPDDPTVRHVAEEMRGFHTFFRNLLPHEQRDFDQEFAWFSSGPIREEEELSGVRVIAEQHVDNLVDRLSNGFFTTVGDANQANRYRLPADLGASLLRVIVDRRDTDAAMRMMLQCDHRPPIELEVAPIESESTSIAELALAALKWQHGVFDHGTLGGPFSQRRVPAHLIPVSRLELRLPPDVQEIRLWQSSGPVQLVRVALQYRASKVFQLSETEFLAMEHESPRDNWESFRSMLADGMPSLEESLATRELANHWLPLAHFLRSQTRSFEAHVLPVRQEDEPATAGTELNVDRLVRNGRELAARQDWLPSLESWSDVVSLTSGNLRREGLIAQTVALRELGESFLADRTLRGLYLFDKDFTVRTAAFDQLRYTRRRAETTDSLEQLLATAATKNADTGVLAELTNILLDNGDDELALTLSRITPEQSRSRENALRAAYRLQWWNVFERELQGLTKERRNFWNALRMQGEGEYEQAWEHFQAGGPPGQAYAAHLASGMDIHASLQSDHIDERTRAIFEWEQWQMTHPGPKVWEDAGTLVRTHAGTESLYSIDRNLYAQFYKAKRDRPLVLRVQGPQTLRFECRLIHAADAESPRDDWIHIRSVGGHRLIAVNGNRPATGLRVVGDPNHVPGRQESAEISLGPGLHEVSISADTMPLLVRTFAQRSALPIGILPPLTPDTLSAVAERGFDVTSNSWQEAESFTLIPSDGGHLINELPLVHQCCTPWSDGGELPVPSDSLLAARLALRTGGPVGRHADTLKAWVRDSKADSPAERALALARLELGEELTPLHRSLLEQLPQPAAEAFLAAHKEFNEIVVQPLPDDSAIRRRLTLLLWLAESDSSVRDLCRVLGQRLFNEHPAVDGLAALHNRLTREGDWSRVTQLTSSAGVRKLAWSKWLPESPSLRVRRSLIASLDPTERLLFGREATVLSMRNFEPARLQLTLAPAAVGHLPTKPMRVACQVGDSSPQWFSIDRDSPQQDLQLTVPAGLQHLRVWVEEPTANHYVRLDVRETARAEPDESDLHKTERVYDVATHDEPIRMLVEGPAWLRIDELRGDTTHTRYISVFEPKRQIELAPSDQQEEALFRVFEYVPRPGSQVPSSYWVRVDTDPLPPPLIQEPISDDVRVEGTEPWTPDSVPTITQWYDPLELLALRASNSPVMAMDIYDNYPLFGQDSGMWSINLGAITRRALEEGLNGRQPDRFLEARATHRHYDPWTGVHRRTDLLTRARNMSGPTFGVLHRSRHPDLCSPLVFEFDASAYAQDPAGAIAPTTNDIEWSAAVRGRLRYRWDLREDLHHTGSISAFGRMLSQDESKYLAGRVDQDIYTSYKSTHRAGMTLSDTWVYEPWLDTQWWLRPSLITNEDFNPVKPDQLNLRLGWAQALRVVEVEASYRFTWFLEDRDRPNPRLQNLLYLDVITDVPPFCRRSELAFSVQHDLDRGSTSAQVAWTWYFDKGRVEHRRWPGERKFPTIQQQSRVAWFDQDSRF